MSPSPTGFYGEGLWDHVFPFSPQTFDGVRTTREGICTCRDSKHRSKGSEHTIPAKRERVDRTDW
jgi:hypothetical protein